MTVSRAEPVTRVDASPEDLGEREDDLTLTAERVMWGGPETSRSCEGSVC